MIESNVFYKTAYDFLLSILPADISEEKVNSYFWGDKKNANSLKEVFERLIISAQNYQFMPNVIGFEKRRDEIKEILKDFDYSYVINLNEEKLYYTFRECFNVTSKDSHNNSWYRWSCSVVDAAKYVSRFKDLVAFDSYVKETKKPVDVPISISQNIRGIGFALACDFLKELGYLNYVKPDVHMIDIFESVGLSDRNPMNVFNAMIKVADDCKIAPYKLDKVLWLICSGNFYYDDIKTQSHKKELIDELKKSSTEEIIENHNTNSENPIKGAEFQKQVKNWFQRMYDGEFELEYKIPIGEPAKDHKFDIVCKKHNIVIECKRYTWTESGNVPSAKMGFVNEAAFFLSFLPDSYKKFIVLIRSYNDKKQTFLADYYYKTYKHLLGNTIIAEYDPETDSFRMIS